MNIKNKINNMDDAKREKLGEVIRFGTECAEKGLMNN